LCYGAEFAIYGIGAVSVDCSVISMCAEITVLLRNVSAPLTIKDPSLKVLESTRFFQKLRPWKYLNTVLVL